jgi:flagellar motor switch protein FliN/FliY
VSALETVEGIRRVLDEWSQSFGDVLAAMTDQRPEVEWHPAEAPAAGQDELLWWEQPFDAAAGACVWVGAPRALWEHAGSVTLLAAGLETVAPDEARNTWFEILGQSLGVMARSIGAVLGREVTCEAGVERSPGGEIGGWASCRLRFPDAAPPGMHVALATRLLSALASPPQREGDAHEAPPSGPPEARPAAADPGDLLPRSRTMDLLLDVDLPVSISFGKTQIPLKDVLKLTTGSIVELNRGVNDQVEVLVNQCLIARGEVVVVEGNYGVRIQQIASRQDRLRSLR